jgi:hypothetical protein
MTSRYEYKLELLRLAGPVDTWTERDHALYELGYAEGGDAALPSDD